MNKEINNIVLRRTNSNAYEYMKANNKDNLSSISISYMNKDITYAELLKNIDTATKSLIKLGIKKGDVVSLVMANIPENIYLFYAINRLGAVANMIDPRLKKEEMIEILNNTNSFNLISIDNFLNSKTIKYLKSHTSLKNIVLINQINY